MKQMPMVTQLQLGETRNGKPDDVACLALNAKWSQKQPTDC